MKIFKYEIPIQNSFWISMPEDSTILSFQIQHETPCIWALVNENKPPINRYFTIIGTGNEIDIFEKCLKYIGTIQDTSFVWHLFEDLT